MDKSIDEMSSETWANVLVEALPYFKNWCGKVVVVKYGGNAMLNEELKQAVMEDIVLLNTIGVKVVLVHGGGPEINHMLERVGKESKFVDGLRYTDEETMEIVQMVLTGKLNKDIVGILFQKGGKAVGLSGVDSGLLRAKKTEKDLGFVGEVTEVNPEIITSLLDEGFIPVVSTVALGEQGDDARYNINVNDPSSLIKRIERTAIGSLKATGIINSGMIPKIDCCITALAGGVPKTHIIDGRIPHSLLIEMFSDRGIGTMIY